MERIIVGVDGSETAAAALRWAAREAAEQSATLVAVMAWGLLDQHHAEPDAAFDPTYDAAAAAAVLETYLRRALGTDGAAEVERVLATDLPGPALVTAAEGAALLVVGARGLGGFRGLLLGSVSQHCLHHAPCPVAVIREQDGEPAAQAHRIVVGLDASETARRALHWAQAAAQRRGATITVVHTWHLPYAAGYPVAGAVLDPALVESDAQVTLDHLLEGEQLDVAIEKVVTMGSPASAILEAAKGAELIVVGSRGLGGFRGMLLGSTSNQVAHHASCPVVVVPPGR
ncbi:MAG: universal stress protein [Acidimicrobiales bacterium]